MAKEENDHIEYSLRDYQSDAVDAIEGSIMFGETELVLYAETSFGKSITAAGICQRFPDDDISILVNIESLIDQIAFFLEKMGIDYSILKAGRDNEFQHDARVHLIMSQTYDARSENLNIKSRILIQDEIHKEYNTKRTKKVLKEIEPEIRIGLSATPWDQNGFALANATLISTISCDELTQRGYLSKINYYVPQWSEKINYNAVKKSGNDYSMAAIDDIIGTPKHIGMIVDAMNNMKAKKKKSLVFCSTIEQCDKVEAALLKAGYNAAAYHSDKSKYENQRIMESFKYNKPYAGSDEEIKAKNLFSEDINNVHDDTVVTCLISVSKLTTGFSVEDINLGVGARPTKIKSLWHQIPGRVRRTSYSLDELLSKYTDNSGTIALVASYYNEVPEIIQQLKSKKINNIDVFQYGYEPVGYDIVEKNVRPNKTHGEFLDLGQCISLHGFPEDPYIPPVRTHVSEVDKIAIENAMSELRLDHLDVVLTGDKPELIDRERYEMRIKEIKSNQKRLSEMTTKEISAKMEFEDDPVIIIAMLATLFDKIHSIDMQDDYGRPARGYVDKKGKKVINFLNGDSIGWMSEIWTQKLAEQDGYYRRKYLKAMRTRSKNMIREKASIWAIRFFIDWLIEQDQIEMVEEGIEHNQEPENTGYEIIIEDDEVPF